MIEPAVVKKRLSLILDQCQHEAELYRYRIQNTFKPVKLTLDGKPRVWEESLPIEEANEQLRLLTAFFQSQDDAGRQIVIDELLKCLFSPSCSAQVFVFLARHYSFPRALEALAAGLGHPCSDTSLIALGELLYSDNSFLSDHDLENLPIALAEALGRERENLPKGDTRQFTYPPVLSPNWDPSVRRGGRTETVYTEKEARQHRQHERTEKLVAYLCGQARLIQYIRLRKELTESANFEINQDRDRLVDSLTSLGFSARLTEFLKFAEGEFNKANDTFSYKTCVDLIRSFFAELLNETAEKVAVSKGQTLASAGVDPKYPVQVREYLEKTGFFSEQFNKLVTGLYRFMSDEGTHTIGATKNVARIARNIAIEVGLLVAKRLEQLKPTANP